MVSNGSRWRQMVPDGSRCLEMAPDEDRSIYCLNLLDVIYSFLSAFTGFVDPSSYILLRLFSYVSEFVWEITKGIAPKGSIRNGTSLEIYFCKSEKFKLWKIEKLVYFCHFGNLIVLKYFSKDGRQGVMKILVKGSSSSWIWISYRQKHEMENR